jgi:DNA primase
MTKIKDEDIDALRERADIVDVVSQHTSLKKAGPHTFKGLCPFHSEKTPSFTIDATKGLYHCFGCDEGGNIYHFVQKVENLSFPESVEWLARRTGYQLRYEEMRPGEKRAAGVKARLIKANQAAAAFFHERLVAAPEAQKARAYLEERGFGREVAERWQLGYAPGRNALLEHLLGRGFSEKDIEHAGLARRREGSSLYDAYRERVIFPTWNLQGEVVGFGARKLSEEDPGPKYLNTAETEVFAKSRLMYGLDRAKGTMARGAPAVVVEGYTDVIALHEAGIAEAVATNGVALSENHFAQLKRFTPRVVLMLDADAAGEKATGRSFDIHHRLGIEVLVAPLPPGRDPADVVAEDGPEAIRKVVDAARPLLEFKLDQVLSQLPTDTPEAKARAVREAARVLGWHPDPIARHQYASMAAERIGVDPQGIQRTLSEELSRASSQVYEGDPERDADRRLPGHVKVEREALKLLLHHPTEVLVWAEEAGGREFTSAARRAAFAHALDAARAGRSGAESDLLGGLEGDARSLVTELSFEDRPAGSEVGERAAEVFTRLRVFGLEGEIKERRNVLQGLNPLEQPEEHDRLFTELVGLEAQRRDLLRRLQGAA